MSIEKKKQEKYKPSPTEELGQIEYELKTSRDIETKLTQEIADKNEEINGLVIKGEENTETFFTLCDEAETLDDRFENLQHHINTLENRKTEISPRALKQ